MYRSILFIDPKVVNYQTLITNIGSDVEVHILSAEEDGVLQMAAILQAYSGLDNIQIISHGSSGVLSLGSTVLNNDNLSLYQNTLAQIGSSLSATGDLLLYGCNVAAGDLGMQFIENLAQYTGADVAASDDLTGAGGDWNLEKVTGQIESTSFVDNNYTGTLSANTAPSFTTNGDGIVTTVIGGSDDYGESISIQTDGKILLGGISYDTDPLYADFALVRYNSDGSLDASFSGDGILTTNIGDVDYGYGVNVQADGKILLGGYAYTGSADIALVRYNSDGTPDTSFGTNGIVTTAIGTFNDGSASISIQADGKILQGGWSYNSGSSDDFALVRYNSNGTLDTSFSGDGKLTIAVGSGSGNDYCHSVAIQADGKILLGGYKANGGGANPNDFALVRYNSDGTLDTSFGISGIVTTGIGSGDDNGESVIVQTDGKILLGGYSFNGSNNDFALVRYNSNGTLDTSFSGDGILTTAIGSGNDNGESVIVQTDGKILLGGYSFNGSNNDFALVRYNSDGTLDTSFSGDGILTTAIGGGNDNGESVILQTDGKILLGGYGFNGSNSDFALVRYNNDGTLDQTFDGTNTLNGVASYTENGAAIILDSSVQIYDYELSSQGHYNGATISLSRNGGANTQDVFNASGNLSFSAGNAILSGTTIGTFFNSSGSLAITFNSNATQARVYEALSSITYSNTSDAPPASVQINWTFNDGNTGSQGTGGALNSTGSSIVNITAVNDAPVATTDLAALAYTEKGAAAVVNAITLTDADNANLAGATVSIGSGFTAGDVLGFANQNGITGSYNSSTGILTLTGAATVANYQTALQSVTYNSTSANPTATSASRTITWQANDGSATNNLSSPVTSTINITAINDAPTVAIITSSYFATEQVALSLNGLSVDDPDSTNLIVTLNVGEGVINIDNTALTSSGVGASNNNSGTVTLAGTVSQLNTLLSTTNAVQYFNGSYTPSPSTILTLNADDGVSTPVSSTTTISIGAYNNLPSFTSSPTPANYSDTAASDTFSDNTGTLIATDPEGSFLSYVITGGTISGNVSTLTGTYGTLSVNTSSGVYTYRPNALAINALTTNATDIFTLTVSDGANSPVPTTYTVNLTGANDIPSLAAPTVANYTDTAITDSFNNTTGKLVGFDPDNGQTLAYSILGGTVSNGISMKTGLYGALTINATTGEYTYTPNATAINSLATNTNESFTVEVSDGTLKSSAVYTVNLTGANDNPIGTVTISGIATQDQILTASNDLSDADGLDPTQISYQWKANGVVINGATSNIYKLTQAEVGKNITVAANYFDLRGTPENVTSAATAAVTNVNDVPVGTVTISGSATQGQTLSASNTLTDADGLGTISYQWLANGVAIGTGASYTLTQTEVGKTITVTASYTDGFGKPENITSATTAAVTNLNDVPVGTVTISGSATQGQTLSASNTLTDADGLGAISYQWLANGIPFGTGASYTLTQAEVGKAITVTASYTDGFGTPENVASVASAAVTNLNDVPVGTVTISGSATEGQTLSASNTLTDADGLGTISYQWQANGVVIGTGDSYTLTQAEVGKSITATAVYTDLQGTSESISSASTTAVESSVDLTIINISTVASTVTQGDNFQFFYEIKNNGNVIAPVSNSGIYLDGKLLVDKFAEVATPTIAKDTTYTGAYSIDTNNLTAGTHTLWIKADNSNGILESDENNNWSSYTFDVIKATPAAIEPFLVEEGTNGEVYIGRVDGIKRVLKIIGGTVEYTNETIDVVDGSVYSMIGSGAVKTVPLFKGSFSIDIETGKTTFFEETGHLSNEYTLAGLPFDLNGLYMKADGLIVGGKFRLLDEIALSNYLFVAPDALMITQNDLRLSPSIKFALPSYTPEKPLFKYFPVKEFSGFAIEYIAPDDTFKIQSKLVFQTGTNTEITLDLAGEENGVFIEDGKADIIGTASVATDIKFGKGFALKEAAVSLNTIEGTVDISAKLELPCKVAVPAADATNPELGVKVGVMFSPRWALNQLAVNVENLNKPLPVLPQVYLQDLGIDMDNLATVSDLEVSGNVGLTMGPEVEVPAIPWLGIEKSKNSLISLDLAGKINASGFYGTSDAVLIHEKIGHYTGSCSIDWNNKIYQAGGKFLLLDGLVTTTSSFKVDLSKSVLTMAMVGSASVNIPNFVPVFGGKGLASANMAFSYSADNIWSNDFIAGWGTVKLNYTFFTVSLVVGVKVSFNGNVSLLGANDIPFLSAANFAARESSSFNSSSDDFVERINAKLTPTSGFQIAANTEWVLLSADWEKSVTDSPLLQVTRPDGVKINEADFAANNIAVVNELSNSNHKVVIVANPTAGLWNINVVDSSNLGTVSYNAAINSVVPTIEITSPAGLVDGGEVAIVYTALDSDSQAKIALFYDTDNKGFDGIQIVDGLVEADGKGNYIWNTKGVAPGDYFIYARIIDDTNQPVHSYSPGQVHITDSVDVKVEQTVSSDVVLTGGKFIYNITVTNNSDNTQAKSITLVETLPSEVNLISASETPTQINDNQLTFAVGNLAPNSSKSFSIEVKAPSTAIDIMATAQIQTDSFDSNATNDVHNLSTKVTEGSATNADISVTRIDATKTYGLLEQYTYSLKVTNNGDDTATNVILTENLFSGLHFISFDGNPVNADPSTISKTIASLASGQSINVNVTVSASAPGDLISSTSVTADEADNNPLNNSLLTTVTINPPRTVTYTDTPFVDNFATVTGSLVIDSDSFISGVTTYGIRGGTDNGDGTVSKINAYGELIATKATGAFKFVPNKTAIEALATDVSDTDMTITIPSGSKTDSAAFTFVIKQNENTESNGSDKLSGTTDNDRFNALAGNDTLNGGYGNDTLNGGLGIDTIKGGNGNDAYYVDNTGDKTVEVLNQGIDVVKSAVSYALANNIENQILTGTNSINAIGNNLNNVLNGNGSANFLLGNDGVDTIRGGDGNDRLWGNADNDTLNGGDGNDLLGGVAGNNLMTGGKGKDTFLFSTSCKNTITDFSVVDDTIKVGNSALTKLGSSGQLNPAYLAIGSQAADSNDYLIYNPNDGKLYYDADGNGDEAAVQIGLLGINLNLTAADFVVA